MTFPVATSKVQYVERTVPMYKHFCGSVLVPQEVVRVGYILCCPHCGHSIRENDLSATFRDGIPYKKGN